MLAILVAVLVVVAAVAFTAMAYRRGWRWTGLPADPGDGTPAAPPRPAKTLWDWLQLLIVPLVLAVAAFGLNAAQVDRDRRQQERRAAQEQELEQRRAARDRESAEDRAREETLTRYLQQMSDLLKGSEGGTADTLTLAQTLTFVALRRLDGVRKGLVVQFLAEAGLITPTPEDRKLRLFEGSVCGPVALRCRRAGVKRLYLENADLRGAVIPRRLVREVSYTDIDVPVAGKGIGALPALWFDGADLRKADFRAVILPGVMFDGADLRGADFGGAFLSGTSFSGHASAGRDSTTWKYATVPTSGTSRVAVSTFRTPGSGRPTSRTRPSLTYDSLARRPPASGGLAAGPRPDSGCATPRPGPAGCAASGNGDRSTRTLVLAA